MLEKVYRLLEYLNRVSGDDVTSGELVLKGGTALNLFFGKPKRLSVDLDFNYVGSIDRQSMLEARPRIEKAINELANSMGYIVQSSGDAHAGRKWYFRYQNLNGLQDRIEVDINYLNRVPLLPPQAIVPWHPSGVQIDPVTTCAKIELVAGKFRALIERIAARDFFDAMWVMKLIPEEDFTLFKKMFVLFSGTLNQPLYSFKSTHLDKLSQADIETKLLPTLIGEAKIDRKQLIAKAKSAVEPLLQLDESEREFCHRIDHGEYLPELILSEWPDIMEPLREHPALLWKAENARKHRS